MYKSWFNLAMLGLEAQQVIWLRTMKLAAGGPKAEAEVRLMVKEKAVAASTEGARLMTGASADSVVSSYRRKVRANRKRLSK